MDDDSLQMKMCQEVSSQRMKLLKSWGVPFVGDERDVMAPIIGGVLTSLPAWPTREAWKAMRTADTLIITSLGLSDPFLEEVTRDGERALPGHGIEVWAETADPVDDPQSSWLMSLVSNLSYQVAGGALSRDALRRHGQLSMEVYASDLNGVPADLVTPRGTLGVLLGLEHPNRRLSVEALGGDVFFCNVRLLSQKQLDAIVSGGSNARRSLAAHLATLPNGSVSTLLT